MGCLGVTNAAPWHPRCKRGRVKIEITNVPGQIVYSHQVTGHNGLINEWIRLDKSIANGMYILKLHSETENRIFHIVVGR